MNGASAEPWANTSNAPTRNITTRIGSSHHFLRTRMNAHSSLARLVLLITPPRILELPLQVDSPTRVRLPRDPTSGSAPRPRQRRDADQPHHQPHRGKDKVEDDAQEHRRSDRR